MDSIQFKRHFAKPADVRANPTAAFAPRNCGWRLIEIGVVKRTAAARVTPALEKLSVHMDNVPRTRLLVKVVHVLGADEETVLESVFQSGESEVCGIRFGCRSNPPPHGIEFPHQPGIAVPSFRRGHFVDPEVAPETTHATKSWNAAFCTHSCPGKNEDTVSRGKREHKGKVYRVFQVLNVSLYAENRSLLRGGSPLNIPRPAAAISNASTFGSRS
jgi:hypothetical protein